MFLVVPQKHLGHFPEGQLPPQESANASATKRRTIKIFINYRIINQSKPRILNIIINKILDIF
jgi:hypothetical protein